MPRLLTLTNTIGGKESRAISAADDVVLQTWGGTERMNRAGALKREGREEEREQSGVGLKSSLRKYCLSSHFPL